MILNLKKIDLVFNGADGKHIHILNGCEVPGCTSISGLFQDDGWKFAWPPKLMYEEIVKEGLKAIENNTGEGLGFEELEAIAAKAKNAWRRKRDKAADSGIIAHGYIERYIKTKKFENLEHENAEVQNCFAQFVLWQDKTNPHWLASELQVGSETNNFAGILDALAVIDRKLTLVDFKTSGGIKDEYAVQLAGLMICLEEMGCKPEQRAILHLPKDGEYEYRVLDGNLEEEKKDFLAGLAFYRRKNLFKARNK